MITSVMNQTVKEVAQLAQKSKERHRQDAFVAEGGKMFSEAPEAWIKKVFVAQHAEKDMLDRYGEKLARTGYELVTDEVFHKMSDTKTPQGILCLLAQRHYIIEEMLDRGTEKADSMFFLLLEDIQDPGNLGTIFRTAEAAGADGIFMSKKTVDIYNPKTIRSTMGSIYRVPFAYVEDLCGTIRLLQERHVSVYAAHLGGEKYYDTCDFKKASAFLIGNEGNGLREETAASADVYLKIPMQGMVESLNAAVAASVLLYESYRQRRGTAKDGD